MTISGLMLVALLAGYIMFFTDDGYIDVIKRNWGICIPGEYTTEYQKEESRSVFGDGDRYYVLSSKTSDIETETTEESLSDMEPTRRDDIVEDILRNLEIPDEKMPRNVYKCFRMEKNTSDCIYILINKKEGKLYTIERFI